MSDGPSQVIARLDAHNRGGREYTREEMERDLRSLEEQFEVLQQIRDVADDSRMSDEFVGNATRYLLAKSNPKRPM